MRSDFSLDTRLLYPREIEIIIRAHIFIRSYNLFGKVSSASDTLSLYSQWFAF